MAEQAPRGLIASGIRYEDAGSTAAGPVRRRSDRGRSPRSRPCPPGSSPRVRVYGLVEAVAAQRYAAGRRGQRTGEETREVRVGRRRLPPARGDEVAQLTSAGFDQADRVAVPADLPIAFRRRQHHELALVVLLRLGAAQPQRVPGVPAESDVGQPWLRQVDPQYEVVERRALLPPSPNTLADSSVTSNPSPRRSAAKAPLSS